MQLINATSQEFYAPAKKSLGNKRNEISEDEDIPAIMAIYDSFEDGKHSRVFNNADFGFLELTVEQPKRKADGELDLKKGKKQPDRSLRSTERVRLDQNVNEYFTEEVLPHIDQEAWLDLTKTRIGYEINFQQYFYEYQKLDSSLDIEDRLKKRMFGDAEHPERKSIVELINAIFAD